MLKIMGNRLGTPEDNRFFQVCVGADPSALGAGYASARDASDEKRATSEYKADGGFRRPRPAAHWSISEPV